MDSDPVSPPNNNGLNDGMSNGAVYANQPYHGFGNGDPLASTVEDYNPEHGMDNGNSDQDMVGVRNAAGATDELDHNAYNGLNGNRNEYGIGNNDHDGNGSGNGNGANGDAGDAGGIPQVPEHDPNDPNAPINLKVADNNGALTHFKIKNQTKFAKLFDHYAKKEGKDTGALRFHYDGERVLAEQCPMDLEMQDGDTIEVMIEQIGGGGGTLLLA